MNRFVVLAGFATLCAVVRAGAPQAGDPARAYAVLQANCLACHDTKLRAGKLLMETTADLLKGGGHGPAVVPGKSAESRLIQMVRGEIQPRMPLQGELKPEEIEILREWVDAGAPPWNPETAEPAALKVPDIRPSAPVQPQVSSLAFSPDGKALAVASYRQVRILEPGTTNTKVTLSGPTDMVRAVAFSPDGKLIAAAGGGPARYGEIVFWDAAGGQQLRTLRGHRDYIYSLAFSPDGKMLASSSYDRLIKLWDVASGSELRTLKEHTDAVFPVAFSPDGSRLASGGADRTVKIWDVASGKRLFTLSDSTDVVFALAFHPSGNKITAAGADKQVRTWTLGKDSGTLVQSIIAHEADITHVLYFPDGKRLASASADLTVKIWNMETGEVFRVLERQPDWVLTMALSPDGKMLALGRYDGTIAYYDANEWRQISRLTIDDLRLTIELHPIRQSSIVNQKGGTVRSFRYVAFLLLISSALAVPAMAQIRPPTITSVSPAGVQRGNTITLTVEGANLADASAIQFSHPGLKGQITNVIELPYQPIIRPKGFTGAPIEDIYALHRVLIKLRAAENTPSGRHNFRIRTPQGTTNLGSLYVGTLVEISEIEPNNTVAEAHRIFFPSTVVGAVGRSGDEDLFEFEAEAGKTVVFEIQAAALGSPLDAELTLLDAEAKVLAYNNDYNGRADSFLAYTFSQSGTYRIRVNDSAGAGSSRHFYRFNIGALPYVTRVFPLGLRKGTTAELNLEGVNLEVHQKIKVEAPANPRHGETVWIQPTARGRESQTRLRVAVGEDPEVLEQENNDTPAAAQAVSLPVTINGRIEGAGKAADRDVFRISLKQGQRVAMTVLAQRLGSLLDSILEVVDVNGRPIPRLVARPVWQTFVTLNDPDSLRRGIRIDSWPALSIGDYVMVGNELLQVEELPKGPDDDIKFRGYRGTRIGYEGTTPEAHSMNAPVYKVDLHKPGSTFPPNGMPLFHTNYVNDDGGQNLGKDSHLIFVAPADGDYFVLIRDIRGLQGKDFAYRLTLSEPRPDFALSVDPQNPNIPRGDAAPLTVTATRLDGFDGPIDVQVLGLPPGVSATQGRILPGANNVTLTLRASADLLQPEGFASFRVAGKAQIDGREVERRSDDGDSTDDSVSAVSIASPPELWITSAGPREIVLEPGQQAEVQVTIARQRGFAGRVPVEVRNLPLGVILPDLGLNGILINENESSRTFHVQVDERTAPLEQTLYLAARIETNSPNSSDHASDAIRLKVVPKKAQVSQK